MTAPGRSWKTRRQDRQYAMKASVPAYTELMALPPALFLFCSLPMPAAQGDGPEKFKELAPPPTKLYRRSGQVQMLLLPHPPRRGASDA